MVGNFHVKLEGRLPELLTKIDPKLYSEYLYTENNKPTLCVKLRKVLSGTLQAAMIF